MLGLRKQATSKSQMLKPLPVSIPSAGQMLTWVQAHPPCSPQAMAAGAASAAQRASLGLWNQLCCRGTHTSDPKALSLCSFSSCRHLGGYLSPAGSGVASKFRLP